MMTKYVLISFITCFLLYFSACKQSAKATLTDIDEVEEQDNETPVNIIEQALPSLIILPSDQLLLKTKTLGSKIIDGKEYLTRDYQKFLITNDDDKQIVRLIQKEFNNRDFPINDLEQALRNLDNLENFDEADNIYADTKSQLLQTVSPNYIIELDYTYSFAPNLSNHDKILNCNLTLIDPVTEKVLSSVQSKSTGRTIYDAVSKLDVKAIGTLSKDLKEAFSKTIRKGREVTIRIAVSNNSLYNLTSLTSQGETIADYLIDYMDTHTKKGTYTLQRNSDNELYFVNARITNLEENGTQFNAYKWARNLCKSLRNDLGITAINKSQKLNEILIVID